MDEALYKTTEPVLIEPEDLKIILTLAKEYVGYEDEENCECHDGLHVFDRDKIDEDENCECQCGEKRFMDYRDEIMAKEQGYLH